MPAWPIARMLGVSFAITLIIACKSSPTASSPGELSHATPDRLDWPSYLGGPESSQYSELAQINARNVDRLEVAWVYNTGDASKDGRSQIQCNPIVIDGVLYATSPGLSAFALDAATGDQLWTFSPFDRPSALHANRGVTYWSSGEDERIFYAAGAKLYALDAKTGLLAEEFGIGGSIDLKAGLSRDVGALFVGSNTPGIVYKDLLIFGTRVSEGLPAAPGDVRAYDVRTGEIRWAFRTIPGPGEFGYETWPPEAYRTSGGANSWAGFSLDSERGIVFVPTGSASFDFYGGDRHGENLFANCVIALDAATGKRIWHYQTVRHDLWDRDIPAPPNLVTLRRRGKTIDAVAQITKSSHIFLLDRETGEPIYPVKERRYPKSDLPGEEAWPTQLLPTKPPPFARQRFRERDVTNISPAARTKALEQLRRLRRGGQFVPPSREGTVIFPGFDGGGEWGGAAVDPESNILYVNSSEMPWILTMVDVTDLPGPSSGAKTLYAQNCLYCHGTERQGGPLGEYPPLLELDKKYDQADIARFITQGSGRMPSFGHLAREDVKSLVRFIMSSPPAPAHGEASPGDGVSAEPKDHRFVSTGYHRFVDGEGNPAIKPPWGTLNAIDLNRGKILWKVVLGEFDALTRRGIPPTGTENYGGPVVTAGGLIFIGATKDEKFRAFDKRTGEILWQTQLPAGGYATPATYAVGGKQYVVIAAGGGKMGTQSGDAYIAFALPPKEAQLKRE